MGEVERERGREGKGKRERRARKDERWKKKMKIDVLSGEKYCGIGGLEGPF